jgi:uncharacterized phage-associated protein
MGNESRVTAEHVARYLIHVAAQGEAVPLTQMHVHKLLYYVQMASLASRGRVMFAEPIEAWQHGPVVADLYQTFKPFEKGPIPASEGREVGPLTDEDRHVIEAVWRRKGRYSAQGLRSMTHREAPWRDARGQRKPDERGRDVISIASMQAFIAAERTRWCEKRGLDAVAFARSVEQARRGDVVDFNLASRHG